jgi:hypothetical protein
MEPNPDEFVVGEGNFARRAVPVGLRAPTGVAESANGTAVLSAVDLTLSFGQRKILSDVPVDVQQGAVSALIGIPQAGRPAMGTRIGLQRR